MTVSCSDLRKASLAIQGRNVAPFNIVVRASHIRAISLCEIGSTVSCSDLREARLAIQDRNVAPLSVVVSARYIRSIAKFCRNATGPQPSVCGPEQIAAVDASAVFKIVSCEIYYETLTK